MEEDTRPRRKWLRILLWSLADVLLIIPILIILWIFGRIIEEKKKEETSMTEYRNGITQEMDDILDFGNYVFSHAHRPHDFRAMIPKVYGETHDSANFHFLALENGKIRGMIAAYPHTYTVGGLDLDTRFIGTVSVHPYARGTGYMKHLMADIDASNRAAGIDMAILGGQRQRYRYFGFENGGQTMIFYVSVANIRHTPMVEDPEIYTLIPVEAEDQELLDQMYAFYRKRPVTGRSREEFFEVLKTWKSRPYAVFRDTDCIGYIVVSEDGGRVMETQIEPVSQLPVVLASYMRDFYDGYSLEVVTRAYETEMIEVLSEMAERSALSENLQYHIYNWPRVLTAFLQLKNSHAPLSDGCKILEIQDACRIKILVSQGTVQVEETDEQPDLVIEGTHAVRALTSPEAFYRPEAALTDVNWFPLTFGMSPLDEF